MGLSLGLNKYWWYSTANQPPPQPSLHPQLKGQRNFLPKVATQAPLPSKFQESHSSLETIASLMRQYPFRERASCHTAQSWGKLTSAWGPLTTNSIPIQIGLIAKTLPSSHWAS